MKRAGQVFESLVLHPQGEPREEVIWQHWEEGAHGREGVGTFTDAGGDTWEIRIFRKSQ